MTLEEYQKAAERTAVYPPEQNVIYPVLGLAGEAGEVSNKVKKVLRDNRGIMDAERAKAIAGELGDVLWYIAITARDIGITLEDVAAANITKLESRYLRGKIHGDGDNR